MFSILWVSLGYYWGKKNKNFEDHSLAGRNIGLALASATAVATWITSNTTMLAPQFALQLGIWGILAYSTASFGLLLFAPMAKRIQNLMPHGYTSGDFMRLRYGKKAWAVFLVFTFFYSITWLVSMSMAGGVLLESLSSIDYRIGMSVILFVCVVYTMRGGLFAVIGTDFIQSIIILAGIVVVGVAVIYTVDLDALHSNLKSDSPMLIEIFYPAAIMSVFNNLFFGIGEIFHNNVWWSRTFAFRKGLAQKAYLIAGLVWFPIPIAAGFIALSSGVLDIAIPAADMVGPMVIGKVLGKAGAIVAFIVVFSSLAWCVDSLLASTSDMITQDLYHKILRPKADDIQLKKVAQNVVLGLGVVTWLVCLPRIGTLGTILFFAGPMVGSMIWPVTAGLYSKKTNSTGVFWGMSAGCITGLVAYFQIGWYVGALVGTIVSLLIVLVSTWFKPDNFDFKRLRE